MKPPLIFIWLGILFLVGAFLSGWILQGSHHSIEFTARDSAEITIERPGLYSLWNETISHSDPNIQYPELPRDAKVQFVNTANNQIILPQTSSLKAVAIASTSRMFGAETTVEGPGGQVISHDVEIDDFAFDAPGKYRFQLEGPQVERHYGIFRSEPPQMMVLEFGMIVLGVVLLLGGTLWLVIAHFRSPRKSVPLAMPGA